MTGFRPPSVAGVSGGVGATTLALALHGRDGGIGAGIEADIVVCRSSAESLDRAVRIADLFDPTAVPPVLAVTVDGAERRHPERLDELGPGWAAVVLVPHVGRWRGVVDPYREAAGLLGTPRDRLPRALRPYLDAVTRLARAVADSGRLGRPAPTPRPPTISPAATFRREPAPLPPPSIAASPIAAASSAAPPTTPTLRHERTPVTTAPPPEPQHTTEAGLTSYRAFVPVGADGPLTSVAVPRPANEPAGAPSAARPLTEGPITAAPEPARVPDLRLNEPTSRSYTHARVGILDPAPPDPMSGPSTTTPTGVVDPTPQVPTIGASTPGGLPAATPHHPTNESSTSAPALDPSPHAPTTPPRTTTPAPPAPHTPSRPASGPAVTHPDLRPVRGIRILDVGDPLDVGGRA